MFRVLRNFVSQMNQGFKVSSFLTITIEILSSLQIFHLIFKTISYFSNKDHTIIHMLSSSIRFFTAGFSLDPPQYPSIIHPIWFILASYLALHFLFLISLALCSFNNKNLNPILKNIFYLIGVFHSRVIYFPIQFFLFALIRLYRNNSCELNDEFYCKDGWYFGTIGLCIINFLLALIKEVAFYQTVKTKDFYAAKTNLYHQIVFVYKTLILSILVTNQNSDVTITISSVFHVLFNSGLMYILYIRLPFYRFKVLKTIVVTTTMSFYLSITSILQVCIKNSDFRNSIQIILLLLPMLGVKVILSIFKALFEKILRNKLQSPDYAIHFGLLLKQLTLKENGSYLSDKAFFPDLSKFSGVLKHKKVNFFKLKDPIESQKEKIILYEYIVDKLENCLKRFPDSQIVLVFLVKVYLKKFGNITRSLELIKKLHSLSLSIHLQSSVDLLNSLIKRVQKKEHSLDENRLNLDVFFRYKELTNTLKSQIKVEIQNHLDFWKDLQKYLVDVKSIANKATEIDILFESTNKRFQKNYKDFQANFQFPLLMYAVYLNNVRHLPYEANQLLTKFQILASNLIPNDEANIDTETTTIVVISLEPNRVGQIIDVTESIHNIFELKKNEVIGFNFGCFFPGVIAKDFQQEILNYVKFPTYKLDKKYKTYGKTANGDLFEMEAHFKLHNHLGDDIRAAIILKQLSTEKPLVIVDYEGVIIEFSRKIKQALGKFHLNPKNIKKIQDITSEFDRINRAFNGAYGNILIQNPSTFVGPTTMMTLEKIDDKKVYTASEIETPKTGNKVLSIDTHLEFSPGTKEDDCLTLNSGKKESHRPLIQPYSNKNLNLTPKNFPSISFLSKKILVENTMTKDKAKQLCQSFIKGKRMIIHPKQDLKLRGDVIIRPYSLNGEFYKIMSLNKLKKVESTLEKLDPEIPSPKVESSEEGFADNFPPDEELNLKVPNEHKITNNNPQPLNNNEKGEGSNNGIDLALNDFQQEVPQLIPKKQHLALDDQRSSVMDYTYKESRFIKTLKEISLRKKLLPSLKFTLIALFLVVLFIITLSGVSFILSQQSINQVEKGVEIVDHATKSLVGAEKCWGRTQFLVAAAYGVGTFPEITLLGLKISIQQDMYLLASSNTALKSLLSGLGAREFLEEVFDSKVAMYIPTAQYPILRNDFDIFTATSFLITKYLAMMQYTALSQLATRDDISFNLNNTANDYMIKSKELIVKTENFLQSLISRNLDTLRIVLASEGVALTILSILLITTAFVVIKAYKKLFRALIRIREESLSNQIAQLEKAKTFFNEEEIEHNNFIQSCYDMFEESRPAFRRKLKSGSTSTASKRVRTYTSMSLNIYLLFLSSISLLFIPILIGLFCGSLIGSMSAFKSFEVVKNQMSVVSEALYQGNMFIYSFAFIVLFGQSPLMKVQNRPPIEPIYENLELFGEINNKLTHVFLKQKTLDPVIVSIMKDTVCPYLEKTATTQHFCRISTKDGVNGLLSINSEYLQLGNFYIKQYLENPSLRTPQWISAYIDAANPTLSTINYAYPFLANHIMENFHLLVEKTLNKERLYFLGVCVTIVIYLAFIYFVTIRNLKQVDFTRREILKIIPFNVIQENKVLSFYLKNNFGEEVETIKNIL